MIKQSFFLQRSSPPKHAEGGGGIKTIFLYTISSQTKKNTFVTHVKSNEKYRAKIKLPKMI